MKRLVADPGSIAAILIAGSDRARAIARQTMDGVKDVLGLIRHQHNGDTHVAGYDASMDGRRTSA